MKKYEVTLYYHTNVTVEVCANNEDDAINKAYAEACDDKYKREFSENAEADGNPDVELVGYDSKDGKARKTNLNKPISFYFLRKHGFKKDDLSFTKRIRTDEDHSTTVGVFFRFDADRDEKFIPEHVFVRSNFRYTFNGRTTVIEESGGITQQQLVDLCAEFDIDILRD